MISFQNFSIKEFSYEIALDSLKLKKHTAIIDLETNNKTHAKGEFSFISSHCHSSAEYYLSELKNILPQILFKDCHFDENDFSREFLGFFKENLPYEEKISGATLFAIESALLDLFFQCFPEKKIFNEIPINALVTNTSQENWKKKIQDGFSTFKIKISPKNCFEFSKLINEFENTDLMFRIDGNKKLKKNELENFLQSLSPKAISRIEYFEMPLVNLRDYDYFFEKYKIPLALDENIEQILGGEDEFNPVLFWIIKPSFIGISRTLRLIKKAEKLNKKVIISGVFETDIGLQALAYLCQNPSLKNNLMGLDTLHQMPKEFAPQKYMIKNSIFLSVKNKEIKNF